MQDNEVLKAIAYLNLVLATHKALWPDDIITIKAALRTLERLVK